jgi:phage shock protein A
MSTEKLHERTKQQLETKIVDLDSKVRASVKQGRDDIATSFIGELQQSQLQLQKTNALLEQSKLASQQALKARDNYKLQLEKRSNEALQLVAASRQAKIQEQLAQTMETFDLGDDASTFNEMRDKIDRRVAAAEAKMQLGTSSIDSRMQDIEREALNMQLQDKLLDYKKQMGLLPAGSPQVEALPAGNDAVHDVDVDQILNEAGKGNN